jgi:hypothetical protein
VGGSHTVTSFVSTINIRTCIVVFRVGREEKIKYCFKIFLLRRIFGPNGDQMTGYWRKLHNEELHYLNS